jgi:hypothetical protein
MKKRQVRKKMMTMAIAAALFGFVASKPAPLSLLPSVSTLILHDRVFY